MTNRYIVDRNLPQRSRLQFYFPEPSRGGYSYVIDLPFFENIIIKESKKARYQKYSTISRSTNLYSYMGADSRKFKLSFNMTLPHIFQEHRDLTLEQFIKTVDVDNVKAEQEKFKKPNKTEGPPKSMAYKLGNQYTKSFAESSARQVLLDSYIGNSLKPGELQRFQARYGITQSESLTDVKDSFVKEVMSDPFNPANVATATAKASLRSLDAKQQLSEKQLDDDESMQLKYRYIDLIVYWVNIIRASVTNNAQNPMYGPPIIRLKHGILYQNIPCICTDYAVDFNEAAGYDINTMLPRQIRINLSLEEIRTGDFGTFSLGKDSTFITRDNLAGWEAVVLEDAHSMDPGAGEFD